MENMLIYVVKLEFEWNLILRNEVYHRDSEIKLKRQRQVTQDQDIRYDGYIHIDIKHFIGVKETLIRKLNKKSESETMWMMQENKSESDSKSESKWCRRTKVTVKVNVIESEWEPYCSRPERDCRPPDAKKNKKNNLTFSSFATNYMILSCFSPPWVCPSGWSANRPLWQLHLQAWAQTHLEFAFSFLCCTLSQRSNTTIMTWVLSSRQESPPSQFAWQGEALAPC